jgi:outer membrane protein assembly factor BamB
LSLPNVPPSVSIVSPTNGANFFAGADVTVTADAGDVDGTISRVDFYFEASRLGEVAAAPFRFTWTNVPAGIFVLTVTAVDNQGAIGTSVPVMVTVNESPRPPKVTVQPLSQSFVPDTGVTLSVSAIGSLPLTYQWQFDRTNIFGATNAALTIDNIGQTNAGSYVVVVSNPVGTVTSLSARLSVRRTSASAWQFAVGDWIRSSPAVAPDGSVYFGSADNSLYALNPDGTKRWEFAAGNIIESSPAIGSDGTIYLVRGMTSCMRSIPRAQKWEFVTGDDVTGAAAIAADGTIYFGSLDGKLYALNPDGSKQWEFAIGSGIYTSPAIGADGTIYFGAQDNRLHALQPDGTNKWEFATEGVIFSSPAIGSDGAIYFGSHDGRLHALNPDGTRRWEFTTGGEVISSPAIGDDGAIYFGSYDKKFYALNPNGSARWQFLTGGVIFSSPAIGADGTIYFGSLDNNLYPLGSDVTKLGNCQPVVVLNLPARQADGTIYWFLRQ